MNKIQELEYTRVLRRRGHLRCDALLDLVQLLVPGCEALRELADLLLREHARLDPGDRRLLVDLIEATADELQTARVLTLSRA